MSQETKDLFGRMFNISGFKIGKTPALVLGTFQDVDINGDDLTIEDMPIKFPGSDCRIPELVPENYVKLVQNIVNYDATLSTSFKSNYVYLTITRSTVEPGRVQRIPGWHVDGFQKPGRTPQVIQHQYAVTNALPTLFCTDPLVLVHSDNKKDFFKQLADVCETGTHWQATPGQIHLLNAYCPHRPVEAKEPTRRFFVRVSFSQIPFTRKGNTKNPCFDYEWNDKTKIEFYERQNDEEKVQIDIIANERDGFVIAIPSLGLVNFYPSEPIVSCDEDIIISREVPKATIDRWVRAYNFESRNECSYCAEREFDNVTNEIMDWVESIHELDEYRVKHRRYVRMHNLKIVLFGVLLPMFIYWLILNSEQIPTAEL